MSMARPRLREKHVDATTHDRPLCGRVSSSRLACSALSRQSPIPQAALKGNSQAGSPNCCRAEAIPAARTTPATNQATQVQLCAANCPAPGTHAESRNAVHLLVCVEEFMEFAGEQTAKSRP